MSKMVKYIFDLKINKTNQSSELRVVSRHDSSQIRWRIQKVITRCWLQSTKPCDRYPTTSHAHQERKTNNNKWINGIRVYR